MNAGYILEVAGVRSLPAVWSSNRFRGASIQLLKSLCMFFFEGGPFLEKPGEILHNGQ